LAFGPSGFLAFDEATRSKRLCCAKIDAPDAIFVDSAVDSEVHAIVARNKKTYTTTAGEGVIAISDLSRTLGTPVAPCRANANNNSFWNS
jgi:hypothetical protein